MTLETLFRLAEDNHLAMRVELDIGNDPKRPWRGYTVIIADQPTPLHSRIEEAIPAAVGVIMRSAVTLRDQLAERIESPKEETLVAGPSEKASSQIDIPLTRRSGAAK